MGKPSQRKDMTGKQFGDWTVIEYSHTDKWGTACWLCECECGMRRAVRGKDLRQGKSKSCGAKHGMSGTTEYNAWHGMKLRCENENDKSYDRYGGRGIKVCKRWSKSFEAFYEDMGDRPTPDHQLERLDNDGDYSPENCVWATPRQNSNNKRNNLLLTVGGVTKTAAQWGREMGIQANTIRGRIHRGWNDRDAVMTPVE